MEEQQTQQTTEQPVRRRRAVRSVPTTAPIRTAPTASAADSTKEHTQTAVTENEIKETEQPTVDDSTAAAESTVISIPMTEALPPIPTIAGMPLGAEDTWEDDDVPPTVDDADDEQEPTQVQADSDSTPIPDEAAHEPCAPRGETTVSARPVRRGIGRGIGIAVLVIVVLAAALLPIVPFIGKTQAVMQEVEGTASLEKKEGYVRAYRLVSDGDASEEIGVMSEAEQQAALESAQAFYIEQYLSHLPTGTAVTVTPLYTWEFGWVSESAILDLSSLTDYLTQSTEAASSLFAISAQLTETLAERIPYETTLIPNDDQFDGIRTMVSPGADGLAQVSYTLTLDPETGAVLAREEAARTVVRQPVSAVSYEGLYPLPDGVSTGTFDWPLPDLPDRDLPLDENGNPYMPQNILALKTTYISSGYGGRDLWGAYDFHLGLDIVAPAYTEISAADGGVVVFAAYTSSYGYMTRIRHVNNVETVYAHQIKLAVKAGDVVEKGQLIGYVGSTGNSSGNHLHLEFRRDHVTVDPLEYITIPENVYVLGE